MHSIGEESSPEGIKFCSNGTSSSDYGRRAGVREGVSCKGLKDSSREGYEWTKGVYKIRGVVRKTKGRNIST